jgi:hypothetical protein
MKMDAGCGLAGFDPATSAFGNLSFSEFQPCPVSGEQKTFLGFRLNISACFATSVAWVVRHHVTTTRSEPS